MSVRIQFDQPESRCYTNLDFVTGNVILVLPNDATISAIKVKLEAESRTRLAGPKFPNNERSDKKRTELELHKLLYKVLTVFPTPELQATGTGSNFTLLAGQYLYPFSFKLPFNNDCTKNPSPMRDLKVGQLNVQFAPDTTKHIKRTLPPTLSGFPGEAEIKYFVKVTVVRPKFFQENIRTIKELKFFPIEPPRPPPRNEEVFARRKRQFQQYPGSQSKKGFFRKNSASQSREEEPPAFQVDARLPSPPILTCNEPLPLRILIEKLNNSSANVYLSTLQIELIGYTQVRAQDLERSESVSWVLMSQANMNMPLGNPIDKERKEFKIPSRLWDFSPIPNTVAPSFETCNISRRYELEVRVGLAHGVAGGAVRPELILLPLRLQVSVYSGIAPPPQLLKKLAENPRPIPQPMPSPIFSRPSETSLQYQPPETPVSPSHEINNWPAQDGTYSHGQPTGVPDVAPPSYEDAMAEDMAPVDGPRRDYQVPSEGDTPRPAFNSDLKGSGLGRRVSERLFASNAPQAPRSRTESLPTGLQNSVVNESDEPRSPIKDGEVSGPNAMSDPVSHKKG